MTLRVVMSLIPFLLLLLINDHGSFARDMNQVDQPYLDGWLKNTPLKDQKPSPNSDQVYLDGWLKDTRDEKTKVNSDSNQVYLDGWLKDTRTEKAKVNPDSNQVYLDGWLKDTRAEKEKVNPDSNQVYLDGWLKDTRAEKEKTNPDSNQVYLDGWLKDTRAEKEKINPDSNQVYLDGWLKDTRAEKEKVNTDSNQVYLDGWLKDIRVQKAKANSDSNQVYLDGWLKDIRAEKVKVNPDSNQVYLDGWLKDTRDEKAKSTPDSNQVYVDGWLKDTRAEKAIVNSDSNQVYLDGWLKDTRAEKENSSPTSNQIYLDGWLKDSHVENAKSIPNSKQAYLDGWLKDSRAENYMKNGQHLEESNGKLSSKVDHTEAFKVAFFSLDDLYVGNVMTLQFPIREYAPFLPKKVADDIPVSKSQSPSLLQLFSLTKDSPQGEDMIDVINQCESEPNKGETKACPTSLESMLEFVHGIIGADTNYNIHSTSYPTTSGAPLQNYTVLDISKDIYAPKWVACHPRPYPYALYYCHYLDIGSKIFKVLLKGEYGDIMNALGICHLDTSAMNPNHFIFDLLGMKPGEGPLCHFFPVKHVLWVPSPSDATK
ncbi:polygalacturonase 1 beta-like protein 3 isoform X11 [Lathyrus oleraceus]|uniref:polygalacturonase 1 beta-like protein 3 isoform X11 n=1 Tax=Pisum sativum TaxID=3888 RepID=UPI0021D16B14|nr:polygalacturonase 1 beta-like protein 3 isoform X11 [Pisum sativum]